jgi:tRNA threonylcarbamoyl adenosine modification protein YjeE
VPSPTFTLVQEYGGRTANGERRISHFDLYRVKNPAELEEIGFFDAIAENIVLVEWPEIVERFLPENTVHVYLSAKGRGREVEIKWPGGTESARACK